jgi:Uma2 family endonuclease
MAAQLRRYLFTLQQYHRMAEAGVFTEDDRVELIEGEILEMPPSGSRHAACVNRLTHLLSQGVGTRVLVSIQNPVQLGEHSEPQPDVALLCPKPSFYAEAHPTRSDILLLIEVADTSVGLDRDVKVSLYARAGIAEVWLVDLTAGHIEVDRQPAPEGYQVTHRISHGQCLAPQALPDVELAVAQILG